MTINFSLCNRLKNRPPDPRNQTSFFSLQHNSLILYELKAFIVIGKGCVQSIPHPDCLTCNFIWSKCPFTVVSLLPCRFTRSRMNILVTDWTIWRPNSAHFGCSQTHGFIEISTTKLTGFWAQSTWRWQNVNECGLLMRRVMTHYSRFKQLRQARIYAKLRVKLSLKWGELCEKTTAISQFVKEVSRSQTNSGRRLGTGEGLGSVSYRLNEERGAKSQKIAKQNFTSQPLAWFCAIPAAPHDQTVHII